MDEGSDGSTRGMTDEDSQSLFICLGSLCSPQNYGPAVAKTITACSSAGANISMLHPVEVQHNRLLARQSLPLALGPMLGEPCPDDTNGTGSSSSGDGTTSDGDGGWFPGLDPNFSVTLDCTAGLDGVVTLSNPSAAAAPTPGLSGNGAPPTAGGSSPSAPGPSSGSSNGGLPAGAPSGQGQGQGQSPTQGQDPHQGGPSKGPHNGM